jgi:CrcB protein
MSTLPPDWRWPRAGRRGILRGMTTQNLVLLACAGGVGALCRYGLAGLAQRLAGERFPLGTHVVNLLGCLLFGLVWGWLENRVGFSPQTRAVVLTGFLGAFTTFSTFAFETAGLLQGGQVAAAVLNVGAQTVLGVALVLAGLALARTISG